MTDLKTCIKKYWGFDQLRPVQAEAIESVLSARDSVVVMPTGGGKSLCFQAPAMVMEGVAVVVSPLISLMKDQVDSLVDAGIQAAFINSSQSRDEQNHIIGLMLAGELKLVYVAPERLVNDNFIGLLKRLHVAFFAIDEAHCISMWGHDFRPEYRELTLLKQHFPTVAIHGFTATATPQVRTDISAQLGLVNPHILVGDFDRPNLIYRAKRRARDKSDLFELLDRHRNESGIIYCIRRADVDEMCSLLSSKGYKTLPYHAGLEDAIRKHNQEAFIQEKVDIIVSTVAFGMGIDKSNVRFVIHYGMPKSLEHYQQESGRAGRDGLEADCCILYSGSDLMTWKMILRNQTDEVFAVSKQKLEIINDYCTGATCRHKTLVSYYGQAYTRESCEACDVCLGELTEAKDALVVAQKILSCVVRVGENFGPGYVGRVLTGSQDKRILENGHEKLSTYGILSASRTMIRTWIEQLVSQNYLEKAGEYHVLKVTERGRAALKGKETPRLMDYEETARPQRISKPTNTSWEGVDRTLFNKLRELRSTLADAKNIPAFVVFGDQPLREMARRKPTTIPDFLKIWGVGERKGAEYGGAFVRVIKDYLAEQRESSMEKER